MLYVNVYYWTDILFKDSNIIVVKFKTFVNKNILFIDNIFSLIIITNVKLNDKQLI